MPRVVFEKLSTLQMLDVCVPTTDGQELLLVRRTEPSTDVALLLSHLTSRFLLSPAKDPISCGQTAIAVLTFGKSRRWINDLD